MILKNLKVFSQNVRKNSLIVNTILETHNHFDIILIQEPPWSEIRKIPSSSNCDGDPLIGSCHHPNWIVFARYTSNISDSPRVLTYVNIRIKSLRFLFRKDILDHRDINITSFSNNNIYYYILNIYSDSSHSALKYLKDTEANVNNVLIMTGDFNIRDNLWDPSFPHHSSASDDLLMIADSFNLSLSSPTNPGPTRFSDSAGESSSVIDLMFLRSDSVELDHHSILPDHRLSSDHAPLAIEIPIFDEVIHSTKFVIPPGSEHEEEFLKDVIKNFKLLDTSNICSIERLNHVSDQLESIIVRMWSKNATTSKISKHSKQWWTNSCSLALSNYRTSRSLDNWKSFKTSVKEAKSSFFDSKIQEIANKSRGPWELMSWVKKRKLPATETIKFNDTPCLTLDNLWQALHSSFNTALHRQVDSSVLNEVESKPRQTWTPFSRFEFVSAISKCVDSSTPGPDKITWRHWKRIIRDEDCLSRIINIADACINLGHWPKYFKVSTTVVIPKPNKSSYDTPKAFRPIVLLNTLGKLIEKVIADRLQYLVASNDFIHPSQLGGLKFKSTSDAGIALTHIIRSGWAKGRSSSTLAFDISQFFPSLNHRLLVLILEKAGLDAKVTNFFANYLIQRSTNYLWNDLSSPSFDVNVGVGQGSALSPILSTLYISPLIYILEKRFHSFNLPISILSFVDDGLFVVQNKSFSTSNSLLFCGYNILSNLLNSFGLIIEHSKTEVFHFDRSHGPFNPPPLDLSSIGGPILCPKESWRYLGFIFDRKLSFHKHIDFYANKALSTVKCMKLLGNSVRGINPIQKRLLYRCCALPIALYGFQMWFYNKAPTSYHMKILNKMQRRAAIWILGAFKTSPLDGIEALAGLMPIRFHLQKIAKRSLIRSFKLPKNHILNKLMDDNPPKTKSPNIHNIGSLTSRQRSLTKGHLIDSGIKSHGIFPSFSPLDPEFSPGHRIIDIFSNRFSFSFTNKKDKNQKNSRGQELDDMVLAHSSNPHTALVIADASIKNDIATSVTHIHVANRPLVKTVHHASFVTTTEAELFALRCGVIQALSLRNISKIVVVTDSIHAASKIFDSGSHPYQVHAAAILRELRPFFSSNESNSIEFWECPSKLNWRFHHDVDKDAKSFSVIPSYPSKLSWDYCKKVDCDESTNLWKMTFQASDGKGKHFLDLLDDDENELAPSSAKGGPWLQAFGHSNSLCARAARAITNHAPIGEYRLRFFSNMDFACPCNNYPIESRRHILHECRRYNGYWNPRRDSLKHFTMFLTTNPHAFAFNDT